MSAASVSDSPVNEGVCSDCLGNEGVCSDSPVNEGVCSDSFGNKGVCSFTIQTQVHTIVSKDNLLKAKDCTTCVKDADRYLDTYVDSTP